MADDKPADDAGPKKSGNRLLLTLVFLNFATMVAAGAYFVLGKGTTPTAHASNTHAAAPVEVVASTRVGPILTLDPIITNLADEENNRYLKVVVQLEITREESRADVERALVPIRDRILIRFSDLKASDTAGAEKKKKLQEELLKDIATIVGEHVIKRVYFTEFVVQ